MSICWVSSPTLTTSFRPSLILLRPCKRRAEDITDQQLSASLPQMHVYSLLTTSTLVYELLGIKQAHGCMPWQGAAFQP